MATIIPGVQLSESALIAYLQAHEDAINSYRFPLAWTVAIWSSSKAKIKNTAAIYAYIWGVLAKAAIAETAITWTVTNAKFNVYCLYIDNTWALSTSMWTEWATLWAVVFPSTPTNSLMAWFAIVNPTGTWNFVWGTTEFDDWTVTPNAVFISNWIYKA